MNRFLLPFCLIVVLSCSDRDRNNPFDSTGDEPVSLRARSLDETVELSWGIS